MSPLSLARVRRKGLLPRVFDLSKLVVSIGKIFYRIFYRMVRHGGRFTLTDHHGG